MIFGARSSRSGGEPSILYDTFSDTSVNTALWTLGQWAYSATPIEDYARINVVDGQLELKLHAPSPIGGEGNGSCYVRAKTACATSGVLRIEFIWNPGEKDYNTQHYGWVTISPEGGLRNTLQRPYAYPALMLGASVDSSGPRTAVALGKSNSGNGMTPSTAAAGSWALNTNHSVVWELDWTTGTMSLTINDVEVLTGVSIGYTPTGDHYVEFGNHGNWIAYNQTARIERFDNIGFTRTS